MLHKTKENLTYSYDNKENITEIRENNNLVARYKYDSLSRIVREDNKLLNKTCTFTYDAGGNILERTEYTFTLVENLDSLIGTPFTFAYPTSGWKDQLLEYNGKEFEYNAIGTQLSIKVLLLNGLMAGNLTNLATGLNINIIQKVSELLNSPMALQQNSFSMAII